MKRTLVLMAALVFALLLGLAPPSHAAATLELSDGGTTVTITDGGVGDLNPLAGAVTYVGAVGANWYLNVSTGISGSPTVSVGNAYMDTNSVNSSLGGGTLTIRFSDTGFTLNTPQIEMNIGGTLESGGSLTYSACFGTGLNNVVFGCDAANNIGSLSFAAPPLGFSGTASGPGPTTTPYSLTQTLLITHVGAGTTSFDASLEPVPEPGTLALLGSGLLGLASFARRKFKK